MKIYGRCMSAWIKVKMKTRNKDNNIRLTFTVIYMVDVCQRINVKNKTIDIEIDGPPIPKSHTICFF